MKDERVEITEEYRGGVLVKYKVNDMEMPLPPFEFCKSVIFMKTLPRDEVEKMFGGKIIPVIKF